MHNSDNPYFGFVNKFNDILKNGIDLIGDNTQSDMCFRLNGVLLNVDEFSFTIQLILTNKSENPYTIEDIEIYINNDKKCEKLKNNIDQGFIIFRYLRKNESIRYIEKLRDTSAKSTLDRLRILIKIAGYKDIYFEKCF